MALTLEEMVAKRRGEKKAVSAPAGVDRRKAIMDRMNAEASVPVPTAAPVPAAPSPQPPPQPSSSIGELATWANRSTQPQSRRDLESQWPTSPPKPVIAPAGPAIAPAVASAPVIPSMPSDAPKVNPLLQGGETAAAPTEPPAVAVNPILEPTKQPSDGSIPEWWQPGGAGKPPEPKDTRPVMQRISDWMTKDTYLNQQAESLATLVMDFIPATIRGVRGNTKMFLESAFGEKNAKRIGKYSKWTILGPITGDFKGFDKLLDASGNLRAEAKARLMDAAKEQGGMTGAVIAGVSEGIADTILALKTMQALRVGYGQEAVKAGAPWFAKSWSVVKSAAVRAGIMTMRTPHDNPKEFAKAYGLSLAYQSTPAVSRHFKDTASVIAADIALNSAITATQVEGLIGDAWKQAEAEGGTPEQVDRNAAIYATISMIQTIGSDIVFGAMTRSFKNAPPQVKAAMEQAVKQAEKVGDDLPTEKPMPVPVDDGGRGPETNPVLATPERPVLISNQPEAARTEEGVRISAPEEPVARVNPLLEPERVAQPAADVEAAPRPAEQVAAPEAARAAGPREAQWVGEGPRANADVGLPTPKYPVSRVSPNSIAFRPEMMQYKHIDDKETGTNKDDKISGAWDETKAGLMLLWEPKNPADHGLKPGQKHIVANGHHRLEAALQNGVGSVNVQVLREADGWSHIDARRKAAEINIADGKGSIYDQANWFRDTAATLGADAALAAGREIGARGRKAFAIGTMAGDDLYSSFLNGKITAEQAEAIAKAAPNRAELQLYGIKEAAKGKTGAELSNAVKVYEIKASKAASGGGGKQLDLLGFDESEMRAMDEQASIATRKQKEIVEQTRTLSQAISRGGKLELTDAEAKSLGIKDRNNRAEIEAARARLNDEAIRWENWSLHEDLVRQVMGDGSFKLESASKAELDAEAKRLADKAKLDDMATAPLEGRPDADIGQARLPGTGGEIDLFNAPKPTAEAAKPTAADLAKPIADHAKGAVTETVKGITELFKPDLGKLGSGPFVFDEGKYAKAKVHFERAWVEAKAAGNSIKEFADWAVRQFGDVIKPYIGRFVEEVENPKAAEPKPIAESPRRVNDETGYSTTSPRMAVGDPEREAIGIKPRDQIVTRHFADVADQARSKLSTVDSLISETRVGQRPVTDTEVATLLLAKTERFNSRDAAARALNADPNNAKLQQEFAEAQSKLSDVFDAIEKAGTSTARGLSAFRMTMDEKYELVNMEMDVRAAKGGQPLTDGERAYLEKIAADYKTERDVYSKQVEEAKVYTAEIETKLRGIEDQILYERIIREVEPKMTSVGRETLVELSQGGRLYANPIDPERVLSIAKWMLGKMAKGVKNPSDLAVKHLGDEAKPVIDAAREKALELVRERKAKGGRPKAKPTGEPSPSEQIRALYRAQVESGVRDVNEATRNVTAEWNKSHDAEKQMTETQVRDTFSDYGKVTPLTKDEVKKVLAELRREAQLTSSIERAASNLHPLKTGKQRFPPSAEARALTKTLNNMLKEKGLDAVDPERQLKSIMDARKTRMLDAIEDKKRAIETMTRIPANKKPPEYDAEAKVLKAELEKITEEYNRIFPKDVKTFTPEERLAVATKAAERSLKMATDELHAARKGIFADKKRYPDLPHDAYLEGLRAQRKIAAQEVKELRELAFPGQKAIKDRIKRLESSIRLYEHKLAVGDFTPRKPHQIDITDNPMAMLQKARMEVLRHEFAVAKEDARYNALSKKGKFKEHRKEFFRNAFNYFRNIKSSYDFSGVGRQGGLMALSNPILWAKSLPNSFRVYKSEKAGFEYWEKFQKRQNFDLYKKAELGISPGDGRGNFGPADDIFRPDIASRVPLVKRHMRAFSVVLNEFRANLFDKLLAASKDPSDLSEEKIKAIASLANSWTGRGPLPKGVSAESLGYIFWAPRFVSSAIDVSTKPFRMVGEAALDRITGSEKYDREMRAMWWKQYGRLTAGMMALYATAYAMHVIEFGNDDEFFVEPNFTSSNAGNIRIPFSNLTVNPFGYLRPTLTFLARAITGEMKTAQGKKMQLAPWAWSAEAKEAGYGQRGGIKETLYDFAQTKQNPFYNSALQIATGKDFYGNDMNRLWAVISGIAPLVPSSMPNLFKAEVGTNWDNIDLERIPVFLMAGMAAILGNQPRAADYKAPRQLKITSTKDNYAKAVAGAVMKGTAESATAESKQYLKSFVAEEGEGPLLAALDSEFDKRRSEQKTYEARMRWIKRSYDTSGNITYYGIRRRNLKRVIKEAKADSEKSK